MSTLSKKILKSLASLIATSPAYGSYIQGYGEQAINDITKISSACSLAETKAISDAFSKYAEKDFVVDNKSYCFDTSKRSYCNFYKDVTYFTSGTLKGISNKKEIVENAVCKVSLTANIQRSEVFNVSVQGKSIYQIGEELKFNIDAKEELFMYIFNIHEKGVELIYPFDYNDSNPVNNTFSLADTNKRHVTFLNKGSNKAEEIVLFLFTKHEIVFDRFNLSKQFLTETLNSLPNHSKRIFTFNILIER